MNAAVLRANPSCWFLYFYFFGDFQLWKADHHLCACGLLQMSLSPYHFYVSVFERVTERT
jgi:hypothetical protein